MSFLLLTLLAVSIAVVVAGFLLSYKPQTQDSRAVYNVGRSGRRIVESTPVPMRTHRLAETARAGTRTRQLTVELVPRSGASISFSTTLNRLFGGRMREPKPLAVVLVGIVSVFVLGLYTLSVLLPRSAIIGSIFFYGEPPPVSANQNAPNDSQFNVSQSLLRISQLDPAQYGSTQEYNTWAYSACSAAAMTEVIDAYGQHHYRITDILKVESQLGEITPQLGLLEDVGIQRTVARFGFTTTWGYKLSLDQVIDIANHGRPVIVSFPPSRYAGGHLVVVTGGNGQSVLLADSSIFNRHSITRTQFMQWWGGFSAIVTPN